MTLIRVRTLEPARRDVLRRLALGITAFGLAGCGDQSQGLAAAPPVDTLDATWEPQDTEQLLSELRMERVAAWTYGQAIGAFTDPLLKDVAAIFGGHHEAHAQRAATHLIDRGVALPDSPASWTLPDTLVDDLSLLQYALAAETQAVSAYLGLASTFTEVELRRSAAEILGSEVGHVIALRAALSDQEELAAKLGEAADLAFLGDLLNPRPSGYGY